MIYLLIALDNIGFILYNESRGFILTLIMEILRMQEFEIIFYDKADGTEPAKDFILGLDLKMRTKMLRIIDMLRINGNNLREPESKPIGDGIMELRAKVGGNISRVLYFFVVGHKVILTNGFIKKTKKTPITEIERAKQYRAEYLSRKE